MAMIYLSSTYEDLKDYRRAVYDILRKAGHEVIGMEDYVSTDQRPVDKCLTDVERADIYVGLFAFRYGCVPPPDHQNGQNLSNTELEYRHAETLGKPRLTFVAKDDAMIPLKHVDAMTGDGNRGERIKALREHLLTQRLNSQFSTQHELSALVLAAVVRYLDEHNLSLTVMNQKLSNPTPITWDIATQDSPYPGLMHFTGKYAPVFFGRAMEVGEVIDRMRETEGRFMLISGASGSGKSSLVEAGVLPRIETSGIAGDKTYSCVRMVPTKGSHPFDALLRPLHTYIERVGMNAYLLAEELARHPDTLSRTVQDIVSKGLDTDGLVVFLDQMEELFTVQDQALSRVFLSALYQATADNSLHVIATIRNDFLQYCHEHVNLLTVLNGRGYYALGPISEHSIHEMITKPAKCAGITISERLVRRLVEEAGQERGSLPLLAFALQQLFDKGRGEELTESAFEQLGGLTGAIKTHVTSVEEKIAQLDATDNRDIFPKLFAPLVMVTVDRTPTRRWASKASFDAKAKAAVDLLIQERLLTAEGRDQESFISVAHEKLFEGWPTLTAWIEANREELFTLRQAEIEAGEWERHWYDLNYLWSEERLKKLQGIVETLSHEQVSPAVRQYSAPQNILIKRLADASLSHADRFKIGQYLATVGDPRPGVGAKNGVPDIAWIDIPGSTVKSGTGDRVFEINPFRIAKYQVTNTQFEAFLLAEDGYRNKTWWPYSDQGTQAANPLSQQANAPRETVSWYEAIAFCRWLSTKTGSTIRLPTEWEWQQAATGGNQDREYPWEGGWNGALCNSSESRLNRTTAVGMYPAGATIQGAHDMTGNVWEWCLNAHEDHSQRDAILNDNTCANWRAVRGGAWDGMPRDLRASHFIRLESFKRFYLVGFRLVQDF